VARNDRSRDGMPEPAREPEPGRRRESAVHNDPLSASLIKAPF